MLDSGLSGQPDKAPDAAMTAVLSEYEALRNELLWRIQVRSTLKLFTATALAGLVSFSVQQRNPDILLACAYLGLLVGADYLNHSAALTKIGRYIKEVVEPAVEATCGQRCLKWETYHRTSEEALRLRHIQYMGRNLSNAFLFGGAMAIGLIPTGISIAQRLVVKREMWTAAWEIALWALALGMAANLAVRFRRWEKLQVTLVLSGDPDDS